jgi:hypothetical protein
LSNCESPDRGEYYTEDLYLGNVAYEIEIKLYRPEGYQSEERTMYFFFFSAFTMVSVKHRLRRK